MASSCPSKALFVLSVLAINEVAAMRTKVSSAKMMTRTGVSSDEGKTPDLDWEGCAAWTDCEAKEGCHNHKVWLDTWRQSCRYTDEYKLQEDQVNRFFPVEIARLEEKTVIFAQRGCLTGGLWYKCYRRMQQILRLFNYVRKAKSEVLKQGESHPAYTVVSSDATTERFGRISENLATGFSKNEQTKDMCIHEGVQKMMAMPQEITQMQQEAAEAGSPLTDAEVSSIEQAKQSAALLAMTCSDVSEAQEQNLRAVIEASGEAEITTSTSGSDELDGLVDDGETLMEMLDPDERQQMQDTSKEGGVEDQDDPDDHETEAPASSIQLQANSSMLQLSTRSSDGPLKMLVKGGWKGLKWLFTHGLGWIFRRIVWTVAFLIGTAFSLVRAVAIWPILLVGCVAWRSLSWFAYDVLWEGKNIGAGFNRIGHCAPEMWDLVGFDTKDPGHSAASQIFVQPAKVASELTGVYHPLYNGTDHLPNPCRKVTCGANAYCQVVQNKDTYADEARCYCYYGTYPASKPTHDCGLKATRNNCRCQHQWKWSFTKYYGCNSNNECKVDKQDPSYKSCQKALDASGNATTRLFNWALGTARKFDTCQFQRSPLQVPAKSVDNTIDNYGKPIVLQKQK